jgi:hypothetical protein
MTQTTETPITYNTGDVLYDLPSPYLADRVFGLLHLPRFLAKIRKHLAGALPKSYQRNFTKGFDGFLCLHLGLDPQAIIEIVRLHENDDAVLEALKAILPSDISAPVWNRKLVQIGMSPTGQAKLQEIKTQMGLVDRPDLLSFADIIEVDENRLL